MDGQNLVGITAYFPHLSCSNVNSFVSWRPKWFLERVKGYKLPMGPEAHRGSAVEHASTTGAIHGVPVKECQDLALTEYDELTKDLDVDDVAECRKGIPGMVEAMRNALLNEQKEHGKIISVQRRVETQFSQPGLEGIKWLGYLDLEFEDGQIIDIKTSKRMPTECSGSWSRQGSLYSHTRENRPVKFMCAVPYKDGQAKVGHFQLKDSQEHLNRLVAYAQAMDRLLRLPLDSIRDACIPDPEDWFLRDEQCRSAAKETWNGLI